MKAIILAAGTGSRLRPYTESRPKCLVEVCGKSLLDRHIAVLKYENVTDITLIGGYLADQISRPDVTVRVNPRYAETNMVWTLACGKDEIDGDIIVAYGDIVYSPKILNRLLSSNADISIAIDKNWQSFWEARFENPLDDAETLRLGTDNSVLEIGKTPLDLNEIEGQFMGLLRFKGSGIDLLQNALKLAASGEIIGGKKFEEIYMTDLLQFIIDAGAKLTAVPITDAWVEIDTPEDLHNDETKLRIEQIDLDLQANAHFL